MPHMDHDSSFSHKRKRLNVVRMPGVFFSDGVRERETIDMFGTQNPVNQMWTSLDG